MQPLEHAREVIVRQVLDGPKATMGLDGTGAPTVGETEGCVRFVELLQVHSPVGFRRKTKPRCAGCGLWPELCACDRFPRIAIETPLFVVRHARERHKPSNTAKLLPTMFEGVVLLDYAPAQEEFDPSPLVVDGVTLFSLYPRDDASVLTMTDSGVEGIALPAGHRPGFVVLDGTWHQCSRMSRRVPGVRDLPCVSLPPGPPSIYGVRTQHDERGVSTFEATVRLLALLEGSERVQPAIEAFEIVAARMLYQKGKLPSPDVPDCWGDV